MLKIDKAIIDTDEVICDNIARFNSNERGLLSQNILSQMRNFVEYIAMKICSNDNDDIDPNNYNCRSNILKNIKQNGNLRFLYNFHGMLQKSVSHYTLDKDASERLMLKYYEYLFKIKLYLKEKYNLNVLKNLTDFPLNTDIELSNYYEKIAEKIDHPSNFRYPVRYNDRYYIQKIKPFFVNQKIYYEITFSTANNNTSKFDRVIAFTRHEIMDNYAVKFSIYNDTVNILNKNMSILIIDEYAISIRPCELNNFAKILGININCEVTSKEYRNMMYFLSSIQMSLTELVSSEQDYYDEIKNRIIFQSQSTKIYKILDKCREIIINNYPGSNILRYLLYKMNNRIIKLQYYNEPCEYLSNLYLSFSCIPFDNMPYCTSLYKHNPKIYDLLKSILPLNHEHELFARYIKNNTEIDGHLFTNKNNIKTFENIDSLINKYNKLLYYKHIEQRKIEEYKNHIYIKGYINDSTEIIKQLQQLSSSGIPQYTASVDLWLRSQVYTIDDNFKKNALRQMFSTSHVALIYGSAGTGKSTLINHIANFWSKKNKLFLANTHPAVDNMRRKVSVNNSEYNTIAKFLSKKNNTTEYDILFVDECSTVSNNDMRQILEKAHFNLLVLVGDTHQIESIYFGNWFHIAQNFIPKTSIFELKQPYRSHDQNLLEAWSRVRNLEDSILEILVKNEYVGRLDESIFETTDDDEIILCLNYDGLYGINNINRYLQNNNPNRSIIWGINTFKVGDPILFNESNIFSPLIHNNTKGKIVKIHPEEHQISFDIELQEAINESDALNYDFQVIGESENGNSIISFNINKYKSTDEDDDDNSTTIPFQVAYAISIHKAQGLEYNSVKIIITNEVEEYITHNIFYTAITRAKNKLKIYWSPETEAFVFNHFKRKEFNKDVNLLANLSSLSISKKH